MFTSERPDMLDEWKAELDFILSETDGLPLTRLLRGMRYSVCLLGLMLPFTNVRNRIAGWWWRKGTHRLRYRPFRDLLTASFGWVYIYRRLAVAVDGIGALAAGQFAFMVKGTGAVADLAVTWSLPVIWIVGIRLTGGYDSRVLGVGPEETRRILAGGLSLTGAMIIVAWAMDTGVSLRHVLIALPTATAVNLIARFSLRKYLHGLRGRGRYNLNVVVVGPERAVTELIIELRRDKYRGLCVLAVCLAAPSECEEIAGVPVYGGLNDIEEAAKKVCAHTVVVLDCPETNSAKCRWLLWELDKTATELWVSPTLLDTVGPRVNIQPTSNLTLARMDSPPLCGFSMVIKGLVDRCAAAVLLILFAPLFAGLAAVMWLSGHGPVLITRPMVGKDRYMFSLYMFRVRTVGERRRRWSINRLPQLFNVLLGDMSLVGPRPVPPEEAERFSEYANRTLVVKPGLTGLRQVSAQSDLPSDQSVRLDVRYVENWSLGLDLRIIWKTSAMLFRGSNAYSRTPTEFGTQ